MTESVSRSLVEVMKCRAEVCMYAWCRLLWSTSQDNCANIQNQELMSYQHLQGMCVCISRHMYTHRALEVSNDAVCIQKEASSDFNKKVAYYEAKFWN